MLPKPGITTSPCVVAQLNMPMALIGKGESCIQVFAAAMPMSAFECVVLLPVHRVMPLLNAVGLENTRP